MNAADPYPSMKPADQCHRFVRWSDKDQLYIGYCPDLYFGGVCRGASEEQVHAELCGIIRDEVEHRRQNGETLPKPSVRVTRDVETVAV